MIATDDPRRRAQPRSPMLTPPPQPRPTPTPAPGSLTLQNADGQQTSIPRPQPHATTGQPMLQPPQLDGRASTPVSGASLTAPPTPNAQPASMAPPTPNANGQTQRTDDKGNVVLSGGGSSATIPGAQYGAGPGKVGQNFDPNAVPEGYGDPRAYRLTGADINERQGYAYVTPDGRTQYGLSEGMGDSFASPAEFQQYLNSLPDETTRQVARFANPQALTALQQQMSGAAPGTATGTGGPMMASAGGAGGAGGSYQTVLSALTGNEGPMSIQPGTGPGALEGDLLSEARRQLANPSVYDDQLFQDALGQGKRALDAQYDEADQQLRAELASRGIEYGGIAGTRYAQQLANKTQGYQDMLTGLLRERATSIGGAREAAFNNALRAQGYSDTRGANQRAEMRGERSYQDALRTQARDESLQEYLLGRDEQRYNEQNYQDLLRAAMQYGQGGAGVNALGGASDIYGGGARAYGAEGAGYNDDVAALLEYLFRARAGGGA